MQGTVYQSYERAIQTLTFLTEIYMAVTNKLKLASFNCKHFKDSGPKYEFMQKLMLNNDNIFVLLSCPSSLNLVICLARLLHSGEPSH